MYTTWPNLPALRSSRWPLGGRMAKSLVGVSEGAREQGVERAREADETGNTGQGGSTSGWKLINITDKQRTTEHQGVGGRNLGEKSLRSGPNRLEESDPRPEEIRMMQAELS